MINNRYIKLIIFFSFIFYLGCDKNGQAPVPPFPKVTLSASHPSISVGDFVALDINVANIDNLFGISFEILFKPSYIEVVRDTSGFIDYNTFTNDNFGPVIFLDTLGVLSVALGGNNLNGKIFSVTLYGLQAETTTVELNKVNLNLIHEDGLTVSEYNSVLANSTMAVDITISESNR